MVALAGGLAAGASGRWGMSEGGSKPSTNSHPRTVWRMEPRRSLPGDEGLVPQKQSTLDASCVKGWLPDKVKADWASGHCLA